MSSFDGNIDIKTAPRLPFFCVQDGVVLVLGRYYQHHPKLPVDLKSFNERLVTAIRHSPAVDFEMFTGLDIQGGTRPFSHTIDKALMSLRGMGILYDGLTVRTGLRVQEGGDFESYKEELRAALPEEKLVVLDAIADSLAEAA